MDGLAGLFDDEQLNAAQSVDKFVGGGGKKRKSNGANAAQIKQKISEVRARMMIGIDKASPSELVALYYILHTDTYGCEPAELKGAVWKRACFAAGNLISNKFNGRSDEAVLFMRWAWRREWVRTRRRERSEGIGNSYRLTWYRQFIDDSLLTDYRVEMINRMKSRNLYGTGRNPADG